MTEDNEENLGGESTPESPGSAGDGTLTPEEYCTVSELNKMFSHAVKKMFAGKKYTAKDWVTQIKAIDLVPPQYLK